MKFIYPAVIRKTEEGKFQASFPDLEEEAVDNANEAAYDWLYLEISEDGDLPPVSDLHDIELQEGEEVRNIAVNIRFTEGWDE